MSKKLRDYKFNEIATKVKGNQIKPQNPYVDFERKEIEQSVAQRFEKQVELHPHKTAVKFEGKHISYLKLNKDSNKIANHILSIGGNIKSDCIALLFKNGIDMVSAIFGALKLGKAYIPFDATYPPDRLAYMLKDALPEYIVTNDESYDIAIKFSEQAEQEIKIINITSIVQQETNDNNPNIEVQPDDLAYILYTSGSLGKPKGALQNHRNVLHFTRVYTNALHINSEDKLTLFSSFSFDAAKMDIYGALLNGATLCPYDLKNEENFEKLSAWIESEKITIYHSIPTVFRYFTETLQQAVVYQSVRMLVFGGEAVYKKDFDDYKKHFSDHCIMINGLGPTESTVTLQNFLNKDSAVAKESVSVGYPVDSTSIYLLDGNNKEAGVYGIGEIVYESEFLALGYLNNVELTNSAFVKPIKAPKNRAYKSGDHGKLLPDGSIEFVGRQDNQVKIKGYRIEIAEIESQLKKHEKVKNAIVALKEIGNNDKSLCGFVVATETITEFELRRYLSSKIPFYMIPGEFFFLDELLYTVSGKIDRKALLESAKKTKPVQVVAETEIENQVLEIWKEVLKKDSIGIQDNYFDVGGHSLNSIQIIKKINTHFELEIPMVSIFEFPTIKYLAEYIGTVAKEEKAEEPTNKREQEIKRGENKLLKLRKLKIT